MAPEAWLSDAADAEYYAFVPPRQGRQETLRAFAHLFAVRGQHVHRADYHLPDRKRLSFESLPFLDSGYTNGQILTTASLSDEFAAPCSGVQDKIMENLPAKLRWTFAYVLSVCCTLAFCGDSVE